MDCLRPRTKRRPIKFKGLVIVRVLNLSLMLAAIFIAGCSGNGVQYARIADETLTTTGSFSLGGSHNGLAAPYRSRSSLTGDRLRAGGGPVRVSRLCQVERCKDYPQDRLLNLSNTGIAHNRLRQRQ